MSFENLAKFWMPDMHSKLKKTKKSNKSLKKKIKKEKKSVRNDYWDEHREASFQQMQYIRMAGNYCHETLQDYMKFQIEQNKAKTRYVAECADLSVFFTTEFAKILKMYKEQKEAKTDTEAKEQAEDTTTRNNNIIPPSIKSMNNSSKSTYSQVLLSIMNKYISNE
tara:strand:- start:1181 stop:1678 length:498 start_codon:yes stop_codon:yes gene_type:complete